MRVGRMGLGIAAAMLVTLSAAQALPNYSKPGTIVYYQDNTGGKVSQARNVILAPFDNGIGRYHTGDNKATAYLVACHACFVTGNRIDLSEYSAIWPLRIGKSAQFIRSNTAAQRERRYAHTVTVAGTERITTKVGFYDTWVLDEKVEEIGGNYRANRRVWFSDRLGWTVKLTFRANDGQPNFSRMMTGLTVGR